MRLILAEGDYVIVHGRFSGNGQPAAWVAADVVRIENGVLAESRCRHARQEAAGGAGDRARRRRRNRTLPSTLPPAALTTSPVSRSIE
jgi:hypothetical protein